MAELTTNVDVVWNGGKTGQGTLKAEFLDTQVAIPIALEGSGDGADPKELLVSSAVTCYIATLTSILENRKLPIVENTMKSKGSISDDGFKITHYPKIVLSNDATEAQRKAAERAIEGADRACDIGNLLKKAGVIIESQGQVSLE